jgi:hypothetical protein
VHAETYLVRNIYFYAYICNYNNKCISFIYIYRNGVRVEFDMEESN